jgi:hypothetical protein
MAEVQAWPRYWQARRASSMVSAAIVDASTKRLFGFANAVLDAVSVQRQPFGGHRVPACAGKHLQRVALPSVRFLIECKISKRPPAQSGLRHCPAGSRPRPALCTGSCLIFTSAVRSCSGRLAVCCSVARSAVLPFFDSCTRHVRGLGVTVASEGSGSPTGLERFVLPGPYELAIFARSSA